MTQRVMKKEIVLCRLDLDPSPETLKARGNSTKSYEFSPERTNEIIDNKKESNNKNLVEE